MNDEATTVIEAHALRKDYPHSSGPVPVLSDLDLTVRRGEVLDIIVRVNLDTKRRTCKNARNRCESNFHVFHEAVKLSLILLSSHGLLLRTPAELIDFELCNAGLPSSAI